MATLTYREPTYVGSGNIREPRIFMISPGQNAAWRRGDILITSTTGSITSPPNPGSGSLSGLAGPPLSAITVGSSASSGAPAATYYTQVTYAATGPLESLPSVIVPINVAAGFLPTVIVSATGAPAAATGFRVYMGLLPTNIANQSATAAGTTLGSTFTAANPLTNSIGAQRAATNASTGILGMAACASNETYFDGYGGSFTAGTPGSRLGSTNTIDPLTPTEAPNGYVVGLGQGTLIEMNLNSASGAFSYNLVGTTAGITLDATTGWFTVDSTQSNKVVTIVDHRPGVYIGPTAQGNPGDLGARVIVEFTSGLGLQ